MIFEEKYCARYILLTDQISLSDCLYFLSRHKFWNYLRFVIKPFFYKIKKIRTKNLNILKMKKGFKIKQTALLSFLKDYHSSK